MPIGGAHSEFEKEEPTDVEAQEELRKFQEEVRSRAKRRNDARPDPDDSRKSAKLVR